MSEGKEGKEGKVRSNITDGFARRSRRRRRKRSCKSFAVLGCTYAGGESAFWRPINSRISLECRHRQGILFWGEGLLARCNNFHLRAARIEVAMRLILAHLEEGYTPPKKRRHISTRTFLPFSPWLPKWLKMSSQTPSPFFVGSKTRKRGIPRSEGGSIKRGGRFVRYVVPKIIPSPPPSSSRYCCSSPMLRSPRT